jgi:hypothetical protein
VNAWRAPKRIRECHGTHEIRKFGANPWSTDPPAALLPPRKRGSLTDASGSRSRGERHEAPRATQPTGGRATPRRRDRADRVAAASSGGEAGRVVGGALGSRARGQCAF